MKTKKVSKEQLKGIVSNIMEFETDELLEKAVNSLFEGYSVIVDAVCYIGNGRYVDKKSKKRYKYKMIVPILDNYNNLYSTDLYQENSSNAIMAKYAIYRATRQKVVDVVAGIKTDYSLNRFDFGYKNGEYGIFKMIR